MGEDEKKDQRAELIGLVQLVIIFAAILIGREVGDIYSSYGDMSKLSVAMSVPEEEMARYLHDTITGTPSDLKVVLSITIPGYEGKEGQVTQTPDYVRKLLISITLSPIVVRQPEVSNITLSFYVEGKLVSNRTYPFPHEKAGFISYLNRDIDLVIENQTAFRELVSNAAAAHGGEVEVTFSGKVDANVLFLKTKLPFITTGYPLVYPPTLVLTGSGWGNINSTVSQVSKVGTTVDVLTNVKNPTRLHSLTENATCSIYREGSSEPVFTQTKTVTAAGGTVSTYEFIWTPQETGTYYYTLSSTGAFRVDASTSPRLRVLQELP